MCVVLETEHFPDGTSEMCTVNRIRTLSRRYIRKAYFLRNRTLSRLYIRNVYCAQNHNTVQQYVRGVYCAQNKHFSDGTSETSTVPKNRTPSSQNIRIVCFAQSHKTVQTVHHKCVYCAQKQDTFQTVHIKQYLKITKWHFRTKLSDSLSFICTNTCS